MNVIVNSSDTEVKLNSIFLERFQIDLSKYCNLSYRNSNLLSREFGLVARDLIYLLYDIEDKFNITVPQEDIDNGRFNNINNIIDIIDEQISYKGKDGI
ncbi:peptide maturation system acyl carrier-related protein [Clostridium sporogenes]